MKSGIQWCRPKLLLRLGLLTATVLTTGHALRASALEPDGVLTRARAAIIARVGDAFFNKYIESLDATYYPPEQNCTVTPNSCSEAVRKGYSLVTYRLRIPESAFVDELLECVVEADGKISRMAAPKCVSDPRECIFPYDETAAQEIARAAGLQPGLKPWDMSFHWHYGFETFVWAVSNTLHESNYSAEGQGVLIDANDGRLLGVYGWQAMS